MGYNYGGIDAIRAKMDIGETLLDFNFEQQADVVADCFLLRQGFAPQWGAARLNDLVVYENFLRILNESTTTQV